MELRRLGASGLKVSAVGLGCNEFGRAIDQAGATAVVHAALDGGITLFDTADFYGGHQSEGMLGKALGARRQEVVLATKFAGPMAWDPARPSRGSRAYVVQAVEASLQRLGTDYIDLYQQHRFDPVTPVEETMRALDDLVTAGKVRYLGCSNHAAWQIADAAGIARQGELSPFISAQDEFNLLSRGAAADLLPACAHFGLGFLPYFPLASGLLTGKYRRGEAPAADTRLAVRQALAAEALSNESFDRLDRLTAFAADRGHTLLDLAFAWLLGQPVVSSVIAGATRPEQVRSNIAAAAWRMTPEEVAEAAALAA